MCLSFSPPRKLVHGFLVERNHPKRLESRTPSSPLVSSCLDCCLRGFGHEGQLPAIRQSRNPSTHVLHEGKVGRTTPRNGAGDSEMFAHIREEATQEQMHSGRRRRLRYFRKEVRRSLRMETRKHVQVLRSITFANEREEEVPRCF